MKFTIIARARVYHEWTYKITAIYMPNFKLPSLLAPLTIPRHDLIDTSPPLRFYTSVYFVISVKRVNGMRTICRSRSIFIIINPRDPTLIPSPFPRFGNIFCIGFSVLSGSMEIFAYTRGEEREREKKERDTSVTNVWKLFVNHWRRGEKKFLTWTSFSIENRELWNICISFFPHRFCGV